MDTCILFSMSGRSIDNVDAGPRCQLVDLGQGELIFSLYLKLKSDIFPGITLGVGYLPSNRYQNMKEHVW